MEKMQIFIIIAMVIGLAGLAAFAYVLTSGGGGGGAQSDFRDMMVSGNRVDRQVRKAAGGIDPLDLDVDTLKKTTQGHSKNAQQDVGKKLFRAGFFTAADRRWFNRFRFISFAISATIFPALMYWMTGKPVMGVTGALLGLLIGYALPMSWLEKQIRKREEDILYFLPLVIEQVSIGVSSALDIGPCVSQIVTMATERDSHNPVTEMFVHVEKLIRSGLNLEDALVEVGETNGMTEIKHAFLFLAQCSRHGGEVSKQLQELADSVMTQRQVFIEGKIASLPVHATGPLATVFAGFFALLFSGLLVRLLSAFGG